MLVQVLGGGVACSGRAGGGRATGLSMASIVAVGCGASAALVLGGEAAGDFGGGEAARSGRAGGAAGPGGDPVAGISTGITFPQ